MSSQAALWGPHMHFVTICGTRNISIMRTLLILSRPYAGAEQNGVSFVVYLCSA